MTYSDHTKASPKIQFAGRYCTAYSSRYTGQGNPGTSHSGKNRMSRSLGQARSAEACSEVHLSHHMRSVSSMDSLLYWHPRICDLGIPLPKTKILYLPDGFLQGFVRDDSTGFSGYWEAVSHILDELRPFPIFLRTDMSSQKERYMMTCRLPHQNALCGHVLDMVHANMKRGITDTALVFRKWMDLDSGFSAPSGLPIPVEADVRIAGSMVESISPYWTADRILRMSGTIHGMTACSDVWDLLAQYNYKINSNLTLLWKYSKKIADRLGPDTWHVKYSLARDGQWYLMDLRYDDSDQPMGAFNQIL